MNVPGLQRKDFHGSLIGRVSYYIFHWRLPLLIAFTIATVGFGYTATRLRVEAGFTKMVPLDHEYMKAFAEYQQTFGGANRILVAVRQKQGDIYNKQFLDALKEVTDAVFFLHGVDRPTVTSLFTSNARFLEVVEDGFRGGNIVPSDFSGTPEQLGLVRQNVLKSEWVGRIVANDFSAALVNAALLESDPETGKRLDLQKVASQLEEIRKKHENQDISIHIIGFAKSIGDIADGARSVLLFFGVAFVITAGLLYWYSGSLMLTWWALICAVVPVVWLLGLLPLVGLGLDPMSILVPFLIFSIGVSHAVQMTNAWKLETLHGADGVTASRNCFLKLFIPGAMALLANALGFMVIALVNIEMVRELALTATLGVTLMIITNKMLLPILLSYMKLSATDAQKLKGKETSGDWLWARLAPIASRGPALAVLVAAVALLVLGLVMARDLKIGDLGKGVPELRENARYNQDVEAITNKFSIGVDVLSVIAEAKGSDSPCVDYGVMDAVDRFEFAMRQVDGIQSVRGLAGFARAVNASYSEGFVKWQMIPEDRAQLAQAVAYASRGGAELMNTDCTAMQIALYTADHQAPTIAYIVDQVKAFKRAGDGDELKFRLAIGNVGVMAATNEVVAAADRIVNLALFASVTLLCLITFRSIAVTLCIILPLALVTVLCNALMAALGIGVKVNTLPVVALGVGVGVDYGIYLFERMKHQMHERAMTLQEAFLEALKQRGTASVFTAITMTIGVATWAFSALKFQADMGILLAFMFLVNAFGAILLLPALAAYLVKDNRRLETAPLEGDSIAAPAHQTSSNEVNYRCDGISGIAGAPCAPLEH